jgi:hypothetical protein
MTVTADPPKRWRLIDDWRWVATKSWSVRFVVLAGLEVAIQVAIAFEIKPPIPAGVFAALSGLVTVAACATRFCAQQRDD